MRKALLLLLFCLLKHSGTRLLDTSRHVAARQKRALIWSDEGTNWVQLIFGLGLPLEVKRQAITVGTVIKAFYVLPTNSSVYTRPSIDYGRRTKRATRWNFYKVFETFIDRSHYGEGKSCMLRTICEASQIPLDDTTGILAEIVSAILSPSATNEVFDHHSNVEYAAAENFGKNNGKCHMLFRDCKLSILNEFSKLK